VLLAPLLRSLKLNLACRHTFDSIAEFSLHKVQYKTAPIIICLRYVL